ncbi:radical SAM protein [Clostridium hydrogeniformans]|uniref:radical SAM protein n=1 Tax=Clostridium hydrogeniformans TaxID=349933 RepID=UPI00047F25A5|nr:radical SAM protein [Clostridium hydrogeniformans]
MKSKRHYIIPIFVPQIGCPHNCVFCNQSRITGENLKDMGVKEEEDVNADTVRNTIEEYLSTIDRNGAIVEVSFFGGTFTGIPMEKQRELLSVAKEYKDSGSIDYIRMSTRPDYIDENILKHLQGFNADIIELGVQSLDEEVLKKSGRGHSKEDVIRASKLIKEYGFTLGHQIMLGLPSDNFKKDINTALESISMKPDICRIYPALVIKDTPMEIMVKKNLYKPYTLEEAVEISKILYSMYISNGIKVIRIGLQPTENINYDGDIIEGPFHPAFRELVEGKIYNGLIDKCIREFNSNIVIEVNPKDISKIYTNKKEFFYDILKQNNIKKLRIVENPSLSRGELLIKNDENNIKMSISSWIEEIAKEGKDTLL